MAEVFGQPGEEKGDKRVFEALHYLSAEWIIYAQPQLVLKSELAFPDYILVNRNYGFIVLEVKDWASVRNVNKHGLEVFRTEHQRWDHEVCPVNQAKGYAELLARILAEDKDLRNYAGKLDFAYSYGVILPNLFGAILNNCNYYWGQGHVLGALDLSQQKIETGITNIPFKWRVLLRDAQVRVVCAAIDSRNKVVNKTTGEFKGLLDSTQESIAKEDFIPKRIEIEKPLNQQTLDIDSLFVMPEARIKHLESELPEEVLSLRSNINVRLVRGVAGTGKTDVLVLRAHYLCEQYSDSKILVTTFNKDLSQNRLLPELKHLKKNVDVITIDSLCSAIYKKRHGHWNKPQDTAGALNHLINKESRILDWGVDFLSKEFIWMKETGRDQFDDYVYKTREGRGLESGKVLSQRQKQEIFEIFLVYQQELKDLPALDWVDLHGKVLDYLEKGENPTKTYDAILIDEAQHFAPAWMRIITHFLNPNGLLFICDDPSQSVFRYYSWRQKGIDVIGKTRWLRINYRNTKEIFEAAYSLIADDPLAKKLLNEDYGFILPDLTNPVIRRGEKPTLLLTENVSQEENYIQDKITCLISNGIRGKEICILHTQKHVIKRYEYLLGKLDVHVKNVLCETGMEYAAVFIPQLQKFFERSTDKSLVEDLSDLHMLGYVAMTRARTHLFMTYQQKFPKVFSSFIDFINHIE